MIESHQNQKAKPLYQELDVGDTAEEFERLRLKSDLERERERKRLRDQRQRERQERERIGASAWFQQQEELREQEKKQQKEKEEDDLANMVFNMNQQRELRKAEKIEINKRFDEYEKMKRRWKEEDERRERERNLDEKREREVAWSRLDSKKSALQREREEWKKEYEQREKQREIEKEIRENREKAQKERDHSVLFDLERQRDNRRREKLRTEVDLPTIGINPDSDKRNLEVYRSAREMYRSKGHMESRLKRLQAAENQMEDVQHWYQNRDSERAERHHRAIRAIYS
uniref:Uncharacterized protein n=1 Tax=Arcella intermedia TaxID=1963864 RepID=A0A6B2LB89_9EUKA